jgi:Uma2 family endonuclease
MEVSSAHSTQEQAHSASSPEIAQEGGKGFAVRSRKTATNPLVALAETGPVIFKSKMTVAQFDDFILSNPELKIERDKLGIITIHPPMTLNSGHDEGEAFFQLKAWAKRNKDLGYAYSPSTSFNLPDGANLKADGAWITAEKVDKLSEKERNSIAHIVPDFVMEVRSKTDSQSVLRKKMTDGWMANGVRLAWLIDPMKKIVLVYRTGRAEPQVFSGFKQALSGEDVLPGFEFDLTEML